MAADEIHVGDIGTIFILTIKDGASTIDVSAASTKTIKFLKPDGTAVSKTAAFTTTGADGKIQYTTIANDLTPAGAWKIQGYVVLSAGSWHTDMTEFVVHPNVS